MVGLGALLSVSRALAGSIAAEVPETAPLEPGLVVLVQDAGERFSDNGVPAATIEDQGSLRPFTLLDNGLPPDAVAGDQTYAALVPLEQRGGLAKFTLLDTSGQVLWSDDLPIGLLDNPKLKIRLEADREAVWVATNDPFTPGTSDTITPDALDALREAERALPEKVGWHGPPWALPELGLGPVEIDLKKRSAPSMYDGRQPVDGLLTDWLKGPIVLCAFLFAAAALVLLSRRRPALVLTGQAANSAGTKTTLPALSCIDTLIAALREHGQTGPVLMLPRSSWRTALGEFELPNVASLAHDQPETAEILRAVEALSSLGRVTVVVDGLTSLHETTFPQAPTQPLDQLMGALPEHVVLVAYIDKPEPTMPDGPETQPPSSVAVAVNDAS